MNSASESLVHQLLASHLRIDDARIKDAHRLDEMGLEPLDLVLVVLRLEGLDSGKGDFPVAALNRATTVGDVVALVDVWLQRDAASTPFVGTGPQERRWSKAPSLRFLGSKNGRSE
jgi:phosphopantetheine binding protein